MRYGICGYGNLGKAVEKEILKNKNDELVGIFSRRTGIESTYNSFIESFDLIDLFKDKIDVMIMCGGSQQDLEWQSPECLKYFDIIDTFDTHSRIEEHGKILDEIGIKYGHSAIYSCGWDPGIFSVVRSLFCNIFDSNPYTFWGKGVSQGHSEALRNIPGILDAIQFTIPNDKTLNSAHNFEEVKLNEMHERHCYICLDGTRQFNDVYIDILNTPNYFKGQKVFVYESTKEEIQRLKQSMYHKGEIICGTKDYNGTFNLNMRNNPEMTAKILLTYSKALKKLQPGSYSIIDIPQTLIGEQDNHKFL